MGSVTGDIVALFERALAADGSLPRPMRDMPEHGVKVGFVADPEGHLIEVVEMHS